MKYYGHIGFATSEETSPGVWTNRIVERHYYGDVQKNYTSPDGNKIVDNINISNLISIVADPYAYENFQHMKYMSFMGTNWEIKSVDVQYPRLTLAIGGVYNGEVQEIETSSGAG